MATENSRYLVDGRFSIKDLIDLGMLRHISERFTQATGFTIGFLDHPDMNVLVATGWRDICTRFHRSCPISLKNCKKSNKHLLERLTESGMLAVEACDNGLVDCATPIIIKGKHIASLATGQLLLKKPDIEYFKKQAKMFGFDEKEYLEALKEIPVVSEEKVRKITAFLGEMAAVITKLGYANLQVKEEAIALEKEIAERKKAEKKLAKLAIIDPHTGLYNYRYLSTALESAFHYSKRSSLPFSVILLDVDYFKSINDVYGHIAGDLVLKQLARKIKRIMRLSDTIIRYGGEEIVIITPGVNRANAIKVAQRLSEKISLCSFGRHNIKLKISFGVTSYPEDGAHKGMDMIEQADKILDAVKSAGGNAVWSSLDLTEKKSEILPLNRSKITPQIKTLMDKIEKLAMRGNQSMVEAVFAFAKTIDMRDHVTGKHAEKASTLAVKIAMELKLSKREIDNIKEACILHDLGKIGISDRILRKRDRLTKEEFAVIKKHPQIGVDIIRPIKSLHDIIPLMLHHHEWWNGQGYPDRLKGEEIPIGARIVAVADVYEALLSNRPYRRACTKRKAVDIIRKGAGTQFDPKIVNVFLRVLKLL